MPEPLGHTRKYYVGPAGSDPASSAFQANANPSQLETRGRDGTNRTPATGSQARHDATSLHPVMIVGLTGFEPMTPSPPVRCAEPNCATARCAVLPRLPGRHVPGTKTRYCAHPPGTNLR